MFNDEPLICEICGEVTKTGRFVVDEGHREYYVCEKCEVEHF